MSKHTPGPWKAVRYHDEELTVTDSEGFEHVTAERVAILFNYSEILGIPHWADSPDASRDISEEEQNANARLIAAAPELLEALQMAMQIGDQCSRGFLGIFQAKARAAIAKARGDA